MKKIKILVTGADGFIGSHLVEKLLIKGYHVRATSYYNAFNSYGWMNTFQNYPLLEKVQIDLINSDSTDTLVKGCDYIFNLAALIGIPYSYKSPEAYVRNNIITTLNLLNSSKKYKIKKFIHTSTSEVYGTAKYIPIDENHPLQAQSPYSASKMAADHMVLAHYNSFNLPATIIRPFNTFGPRQSLRAVIPTIIAQAVDNKRNKILLGSLKPKRDLTFVDDTVEGFIKSLNLKKHGKIINLGSGYSVSIFELANLILKILKIKKKIILDKNRLRPKNSEVMNLLSNNNLAKKILRWEPSYKGKKGLKLALEKTVRWYCSSKNIKLFNSKDYII